MALNNIKSAFSLKGHWHEKNFQINILADVLALQYKPLIYLVIIIYIKLVKLVK
jgi:hypothetical protein